MRTRFKVGERVLVKTNSMSTGVEARITKVGTEWILGQCGTRRYTVERWVPDRMEWVKVEVYEKWLTLV